MRINIMQHLDSYERLRNVYDIENNPIEEKFGTYEGQIELASILSSFMLVNKKWMQFEITKEELSKQDINPKRNMQNLTDYIKSHRNYLEESEYVYPSDFSQSFDSFLEENNISEESIPEDAIEWYCKNVQESGNRRLIAEFSNDEALTKQYVSEMLNAISIEQLVKELNKKIANEKYHVKLIDNKESLSMHELAIPSLIYDKETIYEICEKMMWNFSLIYNRFGNGKHGFVSPEYDNLDMVKEIHNGIEYVFIKVEPEQANNVTEYVKKDCKGIVYHVTSKESANRILKAGLRAKGKDAKYRLFKNKVFVVASNDKEELAKSFKQIIKDKNLKINFVILKIDVSGYDIDFYKDLAYANNKCLLYSYAYFPPNKIVDVTFEFFEI